MPGADGLAHGGLDVGAGAGMRARRRAGLHAAHDLAAALDLRPDGGDLLLRGRRQRALLELTGQDRDRAQRRAQLVRGAGREGADRREARRGLGVGP
jgi:hypothetical protein